MPMVVVVMVMVVVPKSQTCCLVEHRAAPRHEAHRVILFLPPCAQLLRPIQQELFHCRVLFVVLASGIGAAALALDLYGACAADVQRPRVGAGTQFHCPRAWRSCGAPSQMRVTRAMGMADR